MTSKLTASFAKTLQRRIPDRHGSIHPIESTGNNEQALIYMCANMAVDLSGTRHRGPVACSWTADVALRRLSGILKSETTHIDGRVANATWKLIWQDAATVDEVDAASKAWATAALNGKLHGWPSDDPKIVAERRSLALLQSAVRCLQACCDGDSELVGSSMVAVFQPESGYDPGRARAAIEFLEVLLEVDKS